MVVQHGYMSVQQSYMAVQHRNMAVQTIASNRDLKNSTSEGVFEEAVADISVGLNHVSCLLFDQNIDKGNLRKKLNL